MGTRIQFCLPGSGALFLCDMSLFVCSLNSGSNGNCYYVANEEEAVLIDVGISCREIERRMNKLALDVTRLRAVFISHEHTDHISGLAVFAKKYKLPVYLTEEMADSCGVRIDPAQICIFREGEELSVGNLSVRAFSKLHDACDPHSFIVSSGTVRVGIFTDIGQVCSNLIAGFLCCHAVFLEANYDRLMLEQGMYPRYLKNRIRGGYGHLSNDEALRLLLEHRPPHMSHVILSHLSKENNCPALVRNIFSGPFTDLTVLVASRYEPTELLYIEPGFMSEQTGRLYQAVSGRLLSDNKVPAHEASGDMAGVGARRVRLQNDASARARQLLLF